MNLGFAFTYIFQDPDWLKKVGLAAVISLIPIVGFIILLGWGLEIIQRTLNNNPTPLPDWDDFGGHLQRGWKPLVVILAYSLPLFIMTICQSTLQLGVTLGAQNMDSATVGTTIMTVLICMSLLILFVSIAFGILTSVAIGNLAAKGELRDAFQFREIFRLFRAGMGPYIIQFIVMGFASMVLGTVGMLFCFVGIFIVQAYLVTVFSNLTAQSYKIAKSVLAPPSQI